MEGTATNRKPFIEHVHEFRRRLVWCALFFIVGGMIGYALYEPLLDIVQQPLDQTLYYTSPTGGFNFVFKVCAAFGLILALPVIIYQMLKFVEPITQRAHRTAVLTYLLWSANLAYVGVLFGYFVSLPAALHFLTRFGGDRIQALITADEYFSFALAYIVGFALLFQLPLIVLFVNRIKPLKPSGMMKAQRWVILISFIVAAILTPTPDPMNQAIMAIPIIILYQLSIVMVLLVNRKRKTPDATTKFISPQNKPLLVSEPRKSMPRLVSVVIEKVIDRPKPAVPSALGASRRRSMSGVLPAQPSLQNNSDNTVASTSDDHVQVSTSPQSAQRVGKLIDIMA